MSDFTYCILAVVGLVACGYLVYDNHKQGNTFIELFIGYEYETIESENDND